MVSLRNWGIRPEIESFCGNAYCSGGHQLVCNGTQCLSANYGSHNVHTLWLLFWMFVGISIQSLASLSETSDVIVILTHIAIILNLFDNKAWHKLDKNYYKMITHWNDSHFVHGCVLRVYMLQVWYKHLHVLKTTSRILLLINQ